MNHTLHSRTWDRSRSRSRDRSIMLHGSQRAHTSQPTQPQASTLKPARGSGLSLSAQRLRGQGPSRDSATQQKQHPRRATQHNRDSTAHEQHRTPYDTITVHTAGRDRSGCDGLGCSRLIGGGSRAGAMAQSATEDATIHECGCGDRHRCGNAR